VHFTDGDEGWCYEVDNNRDLTYKLAGFTDANLSQFLSRPIKIRSYQWTPSSTLFQTFNPWDDYFSNSAVRDKIRNFRNLRCNIKVKFVINGNPFYYGRIICAYNPFTLNDGVTRNRSFYEQDLVQLSQKPHIMLDPTTSQGGELTCPFIWHENWVDITVVDWYGDLGYIDVRDFYILQHANGATEPITINVFAWAEEVELAVPTQLLEQAGKTNAPLDKYGFPIPYTNQAKSNSNKTKKKVKKLSNNDDGSVTEFKSDGLISKPASTIASVANALSMIPVLAPYAKATSMVATKIGQVARIFGYSRPQVLEDTRAYVPRYLGNLCNTDTPENLVKLSVDSKNELSIDTRVMGLAGHDELTIHSIASRPSYYTQFDWTETDVSETQLLSLLVSPIYNLPLTIGSITELHPTALAFAAAPFQYWQGSIKFRFNVICSEYHRGRLKIVYEPHYSTGTTQLNTNYTSIIDICEDRDFEYEVKWANVAAWAKVTDMDDWPTTLVSSPISTIVGGSDADNGTLNIYVMNELSSPSSVAADIKVQVWVSAGDDFAVACPKWRPFKQYALFQPQSEIFVPQAEEAPDIQATTADSSNAPASPSPMYSFGNSIKEDNQYLVYQGERIVSFRDLLRRYQYHYSFFPAEVGTSANTRMVVLNITDFPYYRGWDPNGPDTAINSLLATSPYTFCCETLLNYLTPAFALRRGGLRHKMSAQYYVTSPKQLTFAVARGTPEGVTNGAGYKNLTTSPAWCRNAVISTAYNSLSGLHATAAAHNPVLEYETPFYTRGKRFFPARDVNQYGRTSSGCHVMIDVVGNTSDIGMRLDHFISTAEDFQLGFFTGAPVFYLYGEPDPP